MSATKRKELATDTAPGESNHRLSSPVAAAYVLIAVIACFTFYKVIMHPGQTIYSDYSDILAQHYPMRFVLVDSIRRYGCLPLWNPYEFCGKPFVGDFQSGLFYPLNWLHCLTPAKDTYTVFGWLILLHVSIGGIGMLTWLRHQGFSFWPSLAGAVAFMLSPKWFYHMVVPGHITMLGVMWVPWLLIATDLVCAQPNLRRAALWAVPAALIGVSTHPQILLYLTILLVPYCLSRLFASGYSSMGQSVLTLLAGAVLAGLICAVHLLPAWEFVQYCGRAAGIPYEAATRKSIAPHELVHFFYPHYTAIPEWERHAYCGTGPIALSLVAVSSRRRKFWSRLFLAIFLLFVLYAMGAYGGINRALYELLPPFRYFRVPIRILIVAGIPLGFLTACGLESLRQESPGSYLRCLVLVLAASAVVLAYLDGTSQAACFAAPLALPLLCYLVRSVTWTAVAGFLAAMAITAELLAFALPLVQTRTLQEAIGHNPVAEYIAKQRGIYRVYSPGEDYPTDTAIPPSYSVPARIERVRGFNPMVPRVTFRYLRAGIGGEPPSSSYKEFIRNFELKRQPYVDLLGLRYVVSAQPPRLAGLKARAVFKNLRVYHYSTHEPCGRTSMSPITVYENESHWPRAAFVPGAVPVDDERTSFELLGKLELKRKVPIEGLEYVVNGTDPWHPASVERIANGLRILCDAKSAGYLVITEMWYPGWKATVNGRPANVLRVGGTFCAVRVEQGTQEVILRYKPDSCSQGLFLSCLGLAVTLLLLLL